MSGVLGDEITAVLLGVVGVAAFFYLFVLLIKLENVYGEKLVAAVMPLILAGISISILFSERAPSKHSIAADALETTRLSQLCLQMFTLLILVVCVAILGNFLIRRSRLPSTSKSFVCCFVIFFITNYVLNALFGLYPHFDHYLLYTFLVFISSYLYCESSPESVLIYTRNALSIFLIVSGLVALVDPDLVVESNYSSAFTLFDFRFWALTSHANNTGPLIVIYLLILLYRPYDTKWLQLVALIAGIVVLLSSQSKTAWGAGLISAAYLLFYRRFYGRPVSSHTSKLGSRLQTVVFASLLVSVMAAGLIWYVNSSHSTVAAGITNLTGRDSIWQISLKEGLRNPIFGYGPLLWGENFSSNYGLLGIASNAHNQFVQGLASAGILGLVGSVVFVICLARYSFLNNSITQGFSVAILLLLLIRSVTEVPLNAKFLLSTDFMVTAFFVNILLRYNHLRLRGKSFMAGTDHIQTVDGR